MSFGLTLEQVRHVNHPLPSTAPWGSVTECTRMPQYGFYRVEIHAGGAQPLHFHPGDAYRVYLEEGDAFVRTLNADGECAAGLLKAGTALSLPPYAVYSLASERGAMAYLFGPQSEGGLRSIAVETAEAAARALSAIDVTRFAVIGEATTDVREKYWGRIETILSNEVAAKRIFVRKGGQSSLEFHVEKRETYYIHAGLIRIGLRIGRAENHSIVLGPGDSYDVNPGVMHMRMALEDTIILEASTRDSDADSFLVEDGQTYKHIDAGSKASFTEEEEQPA
jgi:mannose-6-phosphate isomerase-like protein (cupin superfamily)